jgi:hypothetical protein
MAYYGLTRAVVIGLIAVFAFWGVGTGLFNRSKPFAIVDGPLRKRQRVQKWLLRSGSRDS